MNIKNKFQLNYNLLNSNVNMVEWFVKCNLCNQLKIKKTECISSKMNEIKNIKDLFNMKNLICPLINCSCKKSERTIKFQTHNCIILNIINDEFYNGEGETTLKLFNQMVEINNEKYSTFIMINFCK